MGIAGGIGKLLKGGARAAGKGAKAVGRGAKRLGKSGFAKAAGEIALSGIVGAFGQNLQEVRAQEAEKKAARAAAAAGGAGAAGGGATLPGLDTPETAAKVSNPTLASLIDQVDQLVAIAGRISDNLKSQQEYFVNQNAQAVRVDKEAQLEKAPDAIPEATSGIGGDIGPVSSAIDGFAAALTALTEAIQNGAGGGGLGLMDMLGLGAGAGGVAKARKAAKAAKAAGIAEEATKAGKVRYRDAKTGRFVSKEAGEAAKIAEKPGMIRKGLSAVSGSKGVKALTGAIKGGAEAAGRTGLGKGVKSVVKKLAKPLIAKGLGKTALKSIPLAGAAIGGLFAIGRLLQGDVVGAGLEAASGLGGPLTAIPALVASVARDIYQGVYGVQPEADPEFKTRFPEVMSGVKEVAGEVMAPQVEKKGSATGQKNEIPQPVPAIASSSASGAPPAIPKAANPESAPPLSGTAAGASEATSSGAASSKESTSETSSAPPAVASSSASSPSPGGAGGAPAIVPKAADKDIPTKESELLESKKANSGASITSATASATPSEPNINNSAMPTRVNSPSNTLTSRPGYIGQGNVPDPTYYGDDDMLSSLLFLG